MARAERLGMDVVVDLICFRGGGRPGTMTISMTFLEVAIQDNIDDERSAKVRRER